MMASSSLSSDKRYTGTHRKSSMTVLGRIPKPLNLPSQRMENMGLDPNVEIVPKNTFTWGNKSAASTTNAWGSSAVLSPKNDGGTGFASHITGRPSSGGGTRPSTAGSDKSVDVSNPWGASSRPSTASGALPALQLLQTTNRPRSAETRPGSSQLSRFADGTLDNSKGLSSLEAAFSSGDFPTLEKSSESYSQRGHSSQGRPFSSSGVDKASHGMTKSSNAGVGDITAKSEDQSVNSGKNENLDTGGSQLPPQNIERDFLQPQAYPNINVGPQQFESWRPLSNHPPDGPWQRAPQYGPYRPVPPPGGFPVDHFVYYGQYPSNSDPASSKGGGRPGFHPQNVEAYRPNLPPNSYMMRPNVMPIRPAYPNSMPYDGYFGPPLPAFNNSGDREGSIMGSPANLGVIKQNPYQNDNPNVWQTHKNSSDHDTRVPREQFEHDHVKLVRREEPNSLSELHITHEENRDQASQANLLHPDVSRQGVGQAYVRDRGPVKLGSDQRVQRGTAFGSRPVDHERLRMLSKETGDGILQIPRENYVTGLEQQPVVKKNAALLGIIEDLNIKARSSEHHAIVGPPPSQEAWTGQLNVYDAKSDPSTKLVSTLALSTDAAASKGVHNTSKFSNSAAQSVESQVSEVYNSSGDATHMHGHKRAARSRREGHAKERLNVVASSELKDQNSSDLAPTAGALNVQNDTSYESALQSSHSIDDGSKMSTDVLDFDTQRAKMKEIAAQRAKQLQQEEEERTRQQKAKALAKLEELNRRAAEAAQNQKATNDPPVVIETLQNQEPVIDLVERIDHLSAESQGVNMENTLTSSVVAKIEESVIGGFSQLHDKESVCESLFNPNSIPASSSLGISSDNDDKAVSQSPNSDMPKQQKQMAHKVSHGFSHEKCSSDKSTDASSSGSSRNVAGVNIDSQNQNAVSHEDHPVHNKKGNRQSRNKRKVDAVAQGGTIMQQGEQIEKLEKVSSSQPMTQSQSLETSDTVVPVQAPLVTFGSVTLGDLENAMINYVPSASHVSSLSQIDKGVDEADAVNHIKSQYPKKASKHQHKSAEKLRAVEAVVWAPVNKQPSKSDDLEARQVGEKEHVDIKHSNMSDEYNSYNGSAANISQLTGKKKIGPEGSSTTRTKRAELERYVPKPLSKEPQHNSSQALPPSNQCLSGDDPHHSDMDATVANTDVATDSKRVDEKRSRHGKTHAWRRRHAVEPMSATAIPDDLRNTSHDAAFIQRSSDSSWEISEPLSESVAEKELTSNGTSVASSSAEQTHPIKDQVASNRSRRMHAKPQRLVGGRYSANNNKEEGGEDDSLSVQPLPVDARLPELRNAPDSRNNLVTQPRSHWKPKSESNALNQQVGSANDLADINHNQSKPDSKSLQTTYTDTDSQVKKGSMKFAEDNSSSWSSTQQQGSSGIAAQRRHGQENSGRHNKRMEMPTRGRGYDASKQNPGRAGDNRRSGPNYAYHPVGPYNRSADHEEPSEESHRAYRGRLSNRGSIQFFSRSGGPACGGTSYGEE